jgi:hypothetical protein
MNCNRRKWICQAFFLAILLLPTQLLGQTQDTVRVLFVGNSYTYFWNLPQLLAAMGESQGVPILTRQSTVGGSNLEEHWKREKGTKSRDLLENGNWDYVIMNNHSLSTINTPEDFDEYGKLFVELIKSKGAKPVFYMTWARKAQPETQPTITNGYSSIGKSTKSDVVPVGEIWKKSIETRPEVDLYFADGSHPSPEGTYLNALAFFKFLTGKPTADIPHRLTRLDKDGETMYLAILPEDLADYFQDLVDHFEIKNLPYER